MLNVIKSVTRNGRSIVLTAVLALILVYLFSIVGYIFFKDDFILEVDRVPNTTLSEDRLVSLMFLLFFPQRAFKITRKLMDCPFLPFKKMESVWPASFCLQECVREGLMRTAPQEPHRKVIYTATLAFTLD